MNSHLQLVWNSVLAQNRAVDLAKQHPNTHHLGWTYVGALTLFTLLIEHMLRSMFPENYQPNPTDPVELQWLDSPWAITATVAIIYFASYVFLRWFWRKQVSENISQVDIDAVIAVSFALSLVFMLPQYLAVEFTSNASVILLIGAWLIPALVSWFLASLAFAYAFQMTFARAFGLNILSNVIIILAALIFVFGAVVVFAFVNELAVSLRSDIAKGGQ